jgi:hypothetical protein
MRSLLLALALVTMSCTASLELGRFRVNEDAAQAASPINVNYFDVRFSAKNMQSHIGEYFEMRVVDRNNGIQAKAIYNDVTLPDFTLQLGRVIPKANAPYRLDFWADHNDSRRYDGIIGGINEKDHAWRRVLADPLPEDIRLVGSTYEFEFLHDTAFVDIFTDLDGNPISGEDTLLPCDLSVLAPDQVGKMIELRVLDKASGRLVGLYRLGRAKDAFHAVIPGILDIETVYEVLAYVDADNDGGYSPTDPSWKAEFTSGDTGGNVEIDTKKPRAPLDLDGGS